MKQDSISDSTRVVISSVHHGGVLPGSRAELWRDLYLLKGADVRGPLFGNQLVVRGSPVSVQDSVYVRGEVRVEKEETGESGGGSVTFGSCLSTPDSLLVERDTARVRFLSNLYCGNVNLTNSIVFGNVYAQNATLRNSVVLGGVFCQKKLAAEDCVLATFSAEEAELGERVSLLFPIAMASVSIRLTSPVRALSFFYLPESEKPSLDESGGVTLLDEADIYQVETSSQDSEPIKGTRILTADQRILDTASVLDRFAKNRQLLESLTLSGILDPQSRTEEVTLDLDALEDLLMGINSIDELPELEGGSPIDDLFRRKDVADAVGAYFSEGVREALASYASGIDAGSATAPESDREALKRIRKLLRGERLDSETEPSQERSVPEEAS